MSRRTALRQAENAWATTGKAKRQIMRIILNPRPLSLLRRMALPLPARLTRIRMLSGIFLAIVSETVHTVVDWGGRIPTLDSRNM